MLILTSALSSAPGAIVELGFTQLLGELLPQAVPLVRRDAEDPPLEQVILLRAPTTASSFGFKDATLVAYGASRSALGTLGVLDMLGIAEGTPREVPAFEARWLGPDFSGGGRYWSALMVGQPALLSFELGATVLVPGTPASGAVITRLPGT